MSHERLRRHVVMRHQKNPVVVECPWYRTFAAWAVSATQTDKHYENPQKQSSIGNNPQGRARRASQLLGHPSSFRAERRQLRTPRHLDKLHRQANLLRWAARRSPSSQGQGWQDSLLAASRLVTNGGASPLFTPSW